MKARMTVAMLTATMVVAQDEDWSLGLGRVEWPDPPEESLESAVGLSLPDLAPPPARLELFDLQGSASGDPLPEPRWGRRIDTEEPAAGPSGRGEETPLLVDPGNARWEYREVVERTLLTPVTANVSLLGSAVGGGVTADEPLESAHGWKAFRGLDAVPDHEVAAGLTVPAGRAGQLGLVYRTIQPEAQWGTDHYQSSGTPPVRVEHDQNHGVVLLLRFHF